jgi:hypothetical protein
MVVVRVHPPTEREAGEKRHAEVADCADPAAVRRDRAVPGVVREVRELRDELRHEHERRHDEP